jgi:hypothetical protein
MPTQESGEAVDEDETSPPHQRARSKKWDGAERDKFKRLVKEKKIDPERNDRAYLEKIRKKHWGDRKIDTFRQNWKVSTAEFRIAKFKDGARARSAAEDKQG